MAVVTTIAACGGGPTKTNTPTAVAQTPVAQTPPPTSSASSVACTPAPPGPVTTLQYQSSSPSALQATVSGVTVTPGPCADTATFTFASSDVPGYLVKYVPATSGCGSGQPVYTAGAAQIFVRLEPAVAHDGNGNPSANPLSFVPNTPSIKELKISCDFEGVVAWAIGTEEKYFTVTTAQNPARLIVEVYR